MASDNEGSAFVRLDFYDGAYGPTLRIDIPSRKLLESLKAVFQNIAIGALFLQLNKIAFGEPKGPNHKVKCSYIPMFVHLALVLAAGIYLPATLVAWFQAVARLLG